ncbi:AbrB/MazE/SpoVT family DNA-binding domain-containing protein [Candidatus Pacearchaeota archaeon]|nr:AbrB/MazE/SpoVT family DNA-binding domain-containing protein [Candidatus Pacearchaeota archaeon]
MKTVKVSDKGQIAIPQSIREKLGIVKGDDLVLFQLDGKLLLEKAQRTEEKAKDDFRDLLKFSERSLRKIWGNKKDDIWSRYLK